MTDWIKSFLAGELASWRRGEVIWLFFCLGVTLALSLYLGDTLMGITSSLCGIAYTILAGKGKISCYLFGMVNSLLYGYISYRERLYGEVMLNIFWYFPMMFAGIFFWKRNLTKNQTVRKKALTLKEKLLYGVLTAGGIAVYAKILQMMKDAQPWVDSATTVLSVTAMILTVKRCADQWILWTCVNVLSIWMWLKVFRAEGAWAATLCMWIVALANGILFFVQWYKEIRSCPEKE